MSIPLKRHCSSTTCLLLGSFCPAHALPSVSADCSEHTQEGCLPACRVTSRRGHPGDLCMTPRTCCLSVLAHSIPLCPAGRIDRPDTLLAYLGSWCAGPTPLRSKDWRSVCPRTALPNPCWKHLSWQPSFCAVSKITACFSQKGSLQWAWADTQARFTATRWCPWPSASARTGWVACEADPTEVPVKPLQ